MNCKSAPPLPSVAAYRASVFTTAEQHGSSRVTVSESRRKPDLISRTRRISTPISDWATAVTPTLPGGTQAAFAVSESSCVLRDSAFGGDSRRNGRLRAPNSQGFWDAKPEVAWPAKFCLVGALRQGTAAEPAVRPTPTCGSPSAVEGLAVRLLPG